MLPPARAKVAKRPSGNRQVMTKEAIKTILDKVAIGLKDEWHSQASHKVAVGVFWLDLLKITDQKKRDEAMKEWAATPGSFGTNASALGQALGRESGKAKTAKNMAGF